MSEPLTFISPAIIERIENGSFVPARRSQTNLQMSDRRDVLSPLAVTKRCIRYEPHVFHHRQATILRMANALNQPERKILLVGGLQGSGKTSLVRGVIELMGSRNEQLLWFDVNRHTDFEEIIQFLIQYITYVCSAVGDMPGNTFRRASDVQAGAEDPIRRLEGLISQVADMPLLIVLDNVEFIVDAELRFNSYPFKEMLNFLLAFPNIKMVLVGERLPYADMSPNQEGVEDIRLEGLPEQEATRFLQSRRKPNRETAPDPAVLELAAAPEAEMVALRQLYHKTSGYPWLLKILFYLNHQANLDFYTVNRLLESNAKGEEQALPVPDLVGYIYQRLPDQHRRLFQVLSFIRHPVNANTLLSLVNVCYPVLGPSQLDRETVEDMLEHSLLKGLLKISYPPQEVLAHIRNRKQTSDPDGREKKFKAWYELYHSVKRILYGSLPQEERDRIHAVLQDFYMREKAQEPVNRILRIKNRAIIAEAKYHGSAARERKAGLPSLSLGAEPVEPASIVSKAYLSRTVRPAPNPYRMTLEDYRSIRLPGHDVEGEEGASLSATFEQALEESAGKLTLQEQLADIELTDEEKELLFQKEAELEAFREQARHPHEQAAPPTPMPADDPARTLEGDANAHSRSSDDMEHLLQDSHEDEQEKAIQKRLAAAVAAQDKPVMVRELVALARYRAGHGGYKSAGQCLEKALSLKADASKATLAEIYRLSGSVNKETYHHNAALASLSKAAVEIRKLMYEDDTVDAAWMGYLGKVYQDLGEIFAYRKQYTEAVDSFSQALRWYFSADDDVHKAEVHFQLAGVYDDLQETELAIEHYQKSLTLDEANGNRLSAASALANLGNLYRDQGRWSEAIECFQRSFRLDREIGNVEGQLTTLDTLATTFMLHEALPKAERVAKQGLAHALQAGSELWKASFYMKLGQVYELQQDWKQALSHFQLAYSTGAQELSRQSLHWIEEKIAEVKALISEG